MVTCSVCKNLYPCGKRTLKLIKDYEIPFTCPKCGNIKFPWRAVNGIVIVWSKPIPDKQGSIIIPECVKPIFQTGWAVVLSAGAGCVEKETGKFVGCELRRGDVVHRDKNTPWTMLVEAGNGRLYDVPYMNMFDVSFIQEPEDE